jgi:hypothetical protein
MQVNDEKTTDKDPLQAFWVGQIEIYEQKFQGWEKRSKKINKRFIDERDGNKKASRFNILWANVQTLKPALYASRPKPNIDRRYQDDDDLGRYAALVLERSVSYYVGEEIFNDSMKQVVLDRLIGGRGTAWVRYVPVFQPVEQVTDDTEVEPEEELYSEDTLPDYVHWQDFGHTWARTWQEVRAVWRIVYLGRAELIKRFGDVGKTIPLDACPEGKEEGLETAKKATIYEIWDKTTKKAIWLHKTAEKLLDKRDDPLGLKDFFPCPKPVYATLTNDNLIPTPDFYIYQDQANELDQLTARISSITAAIKVAGVYDASAQGVDRLLSEGVENKLIPVEQWAIFGEKGGLKGVINFLPMVEIVQTLQSLYEARESVKQIIYEITGISDIIRGASKASETATAQQLKGQYATLRLDEQQGDVARFGRDLVRIMTEIIAQHFSMDTIKKVSGIKLLTNAEKQEIQAQQQQIAAMQQAMQAGQMQPNMQTPPEIPEETLELVDMPSWEDVEALIRDDAARCFNIDIETDSTIKTDQEAEKAARVEFLTAAGGFMEKGVMLPADLQPLALEMLMFGVRGFKVSRELETSFENTISKMKKAMDNPAPAQPDPAIAEAQQKMQGEQAKLQAQQATDQAKLQSQVQIEQMKLSAEQQREAARLQFDQQQAQIENELEFRRLALEEKKGQQELIKAWLGSQNKETGEVMPEEPDMLNEVIAAFSNGLQELVANQQLSNQSLVDAITAPKEVLKDAQGRILGVRSVQ